MPFALLLFLFFLYCEYKHLGLIDKSEYVDILIITTIMDELTCCVFFTLFEALLW